MKKLLTFLLAFLFSASAFCFFAPKNVSYAESNQTQVLISRDYDFERFSSFTPFNFQTETRMSGKSASFDYDERNAYNQSFSVDETINVDGNNGIGFWMYFSTKNLHNLTIVLSNLSASIEFSLSAEELKDLLTKQEIIEDQANDGYGWNYIELPFVSAQKNNVSLDSQMAISSVNIIFNSSETEGENFAKTYVYEISVIPVNSQSPYILEANKQGFRIFKAVFYSEEDLNKICVGDQIAMKRRAQLIKYAWVGETDVNSVSYPLEIRLSFGDEEKIWEQDEVYEFSKSGQHILKFYVLNNDHDILLSQIVSFSVTEFIGINFNQNITTFKVGDRVVFNLTLNKNLVTIHDLHFEIVGDCAKILSEDSEKACVVVEMIKVGKFRLSASGQADRLFTNSVDVSATKNFTIENERVADNSALIIISIVVLSSIGLAGVIFGIKSIIKANKYKVR